MRVALYSIIFFLITGCILQEAVLLSTDEENYHVGDPVKIAIENKTNNPIFFGGCNEFLVQRKVGVDWKPVMQKICVWEGIPQRLLPQESISFVINISQEGLYRTKFDYGVGCEEGKPLSQAGCLRHNTIFHIFRVFP